MMATLLRSAPVRLASDSFAFVEDGEVQDRTHQVGVGQIGPVRLALEQPNAPRELKAAPALQLHEWVTPWTHKKSPRGPIGGWRVRTHLPTRCTSLHCAGPSRLRWK